MMKPYMISELSIPTEDFKSAANVMAHLQNIEPRLEPSLGGKNGQPITMN